MSDEDAVDASADSAIEPAEDEEYVHGFDPDELQAFKAAAEHFATEMEVVRNAVVAAFSGENGEIALFFMGNYCKAARTTYTQGDSHHSAFLEGRRSFYNKILEYMHLDDRQLIEMAANRATGAR